MLRVVGPDAYRSGSLRVELHRLQEAAIDAIDQVNLLMVLHVRVDAERATDFVLHELPAQDFEADHALIKVLLNRLVQVTPNSSVTVLFDNCGRLTLSLLSLINAVTEAIPHICHVIGGVEKLQIGCQVL